MRLGGRIAAAIEVLDDIARRRRPAADALKDWGLSHRFAGAGDRAAIGNLVYDGLRRRRSACFLLGAETSRAIAFGAMILESGETPASINAALDGDRFAPPSLDAAELAAIAANDLAAAPPAVRADCPDWCEPLFQRAFGDGWVAEAEALAGRPPLDLRVNSLKADRDKVGAELADVGARPTAIAPHGLRIAPIEGGGRHPNVQAEPAFQKGWFEVQDEGSQIVAALGGARPGMQVLDFCAGAGGKTLAMAAAMENHGQIFAYDAEKGRLAPIFDRLRRADCRNVQVMARAGELEPLRGRMDLVLVDAPCTGSGTWRRRPDAKWRLSEKQLGVRVAEQAAILDAAAGFVKPGGRLAYITCSMFDEENGRSVAAFLDRADGDFSTEDHTRLAAAELPQLAGRIRHCAPAGVQLTPLSAGTDGFYFCALRRGA